MKVNELSKDLGIQNKDLITFFQSNGFKVSSHMQNVTDEMIDLAHENFTQAVEDIVVDSVVTKQETIQESLPPVSTRTFLPDDTIPCKSVVPYKLVEVGADGHTVYNWEYYGDIDYVKYSDLQSWRRKKTVMDPRILILDEDLCYQWRRELGNTYDKYLGVDYPEDFFSVSDEEFRSLLNKAPEVLRNVIKTTAVAMVRAENYPSVTKLKMIDEILGTCISEFLV